MAVVQIPLQKVPSQSVAVALDGQRCVIVLRQLGDRQYLSLSKNGVAICESVLLVNASIVVRAAHRGFTGELSVVDTRGAEPPAYTGWNDRWLLLFNSDV